MKTDFKQEIFDKVAKHLLTQKARCTDPLTGSCLYFNPETKMKCAAGCLIPDRDYSKSFEGHGVSSNSKIRDFFLNSGYSGDELQLIFDLQIIHDQYKPKKWKLELKKVAKFYNINHDVLKSFQ